MSRSTTRFGDLNRVFKNGDSELLNHVGALCILFEDFRHEFASLTVPYANEENLPIKTYPVLYYVRRSLVTLDEAKERLKSISTNKEFQAAKDQMEERFYSDVIKARRFISSNSVLNNFRNYMGAHVDPEKVVQSSIRYMGPGAISKIGWKNSEKDFPLQLDFATHIIGGAMASHLPGGVEALGVELDKFLGVMQKAYHHLAHATFSLVYVFLWDKFGTA